MNSEIEIERSLQFMKKLGELVEAQTYTKTVQKNKQIDEQTN